MKSCPLTRVSVSGGLTVSHCAETVSCHLSLRMARMEMN